MFAWYSVHVVICLGVTRLLKVLFGRKRPVKPDYTNDAALNSRTIDLRSQCTTNSFPSSESAQAGMFSFFLMTNFPLATAAFSGYIVQFVLMVGFSRVYFHCHYMSDVVLGTLTGIVLASLIASSGSQDLLKTMLLAMKNTIFSNDEDDLYHDEF